ncbi:MAG: hypothetical protein JW818_13215 [Pirellulales bacterium]|nr:hypothetical protein [Pirellulales bacterium]
MKHRWLLLLSLLTAEHVVFVAATVWLAPVGEIFGAIIFAWMVLPAFTAAVLCGPVRQRIIAATLNGFIAATIFNYLFLVHGYHWPETPKGAPALACAYLLLGLGISAGCGAFASVIAKELDTKAPTTKGQRLLIATKKGFRFSLLCAVLTTPVLALLWPPHARYGLLPAAAVYAVSIMALGLAAASVVGAAYHSSRRDVSH